MARPRSEYPTELELQVLKILWHASPRLVRDIRQALADQGRDLAHTSVITTLNTMARKKYLKRTRQGKSFLFEPRLSRDDVYTRVLRDIVKRVFDGSATAVMAGLFGCTEVDNEELKGLRKLIDKQLRGM